MPPNKTGRLTASADFKRVYRQGRSQANPLLILYYFDKGAGEESRIGFSVSRKIGGAVERNRIKRVLREIFRKHVEGLKSDYDYVIIARRPATDAGFNELEEAMLALFEKAKLVE